MIFWLVLKIEISSRVMIFWFLLEKFFCKTILLRGEIFEFP
jgi:hypothetical protein